MYEQPAFDNMQYPLGKENIIFSINDAETIGYPYAKNLL